MPATEATFEDRKLVRAVRRYQEMLAAKRKGRLTLWTDGSGKTVDCELAEKVE